MRDCSSLQTNPVRSFIEIYPPVHPLPLSPIGREAELCMLVDDDIRLVASLQFLSSLPPSLFSRHTNVNAGHSYDRRRIKREY